MKRHILLIASVLYLLMSCDTGFLDKTPTNSISSGNMWTTESLADAGMDALMYPLYKTDVTSARLTRASGYNGYNRAIMEGCGSTSYQTGSALYTNWLHNSAKKASDYQMQVDWEVMYTVIHACNDAIQNLIEDPLGTEKYQRYQCQARLLRAFCYYRLNALFGGVPLYLEVVTNEDCTKIQSSFTEVFEAVIEDCEYAIDNEYLPDNTLSNYYGTPSKGMAYALKGMCCMWLAANIAPLAAYSDETVEYLSDSEVEEYYETAVECFEKVAECGYSLWTGEWAELFTVENEVNSEMIFPLQFLSETGYSSNWQQFIGGTDNWIGWNNVMPRPEFVDSYQWNDGSEFDWTQIFPEWNELEPIQRAVFFFRDSLENVEDMIAYWDNLLETETNSTKLDNISVQREHYTTLQTNRDNAIDRCGQDIYDKYYLNIGNEARLRTAYDTRDPRLDATVMTPYTDVTVYNPAYMTRVLIKQHRWPMKGRNNEDDYSDYWGNKTDTMYYIYKKYNVMDDSLEGENSGRSRCPCDWPIIRYTQIYLLHAEALIQLGRLSEAKTMLDVIRARVGMPAITLGSQEEMMAALRYESRVELCQEGVNFLDDIRWGRIKEDKFLGQDNYYIINMWGDGTTTYDYNIYYVDTMWPWTVCTDECQKNTNMKRRDGWVY